MASPDCLPPAIRLAPYQAADRSALARLLADPLLRRELYPQRLRPPAIDEAVAGWQQPPADPHGLQLTVSIEDRRAVGFVRLEQGELAYFVARVHWGRGYAGAAIGSLTRDFLAAPGPSTVVAVVARDNPASTKVLERNGFVFTGLLRSPLRSPRCLLSYAYRVPPVPPVPATP